MGVIIAEITQLKKQQKKIKYKKKRRERTHTHVHNRCANAAAARENVAFWWKGRAPSRCAARVTSPQSVIIITLPPARSVYEHIYAAERNAGSGGI